MRLSGGSFRGRALAGATGPGLRPATAKTRLAVFSMLAARSLDLENAAVLDLFAGTGSLGFEALSRGAASCLFVEQNPKAARAIRESLRQLGVAAHAARVEQADVFTFLRRKCPRPFELIFIDPPYGQGFAPPAIEAVLSGGYCAPGTFIVAEIEAAVPDPVTAAAPLELLADKRYGQTRILLWRQKNAWPSTPAPSTP